ncbi:MAG: hypothetical protein JW996_04765 [Candidatus Cloacimonetes bacterium]|nr:hypothetical protein [Candidatus Cloacimonadota bacterium]
MNIEFHYYVVKYLALEAGFDSGEAQIIAYSSQFVDDNTYTVKIRKPDSEIYENQISQTPDVLAPQTHTMRIYPLFHYLPGDPTSAKASRRDGKMHILMTTPASTHAQEIFFESTKNEDLYLLGIASHMLSDTFFNQNFIGNCDGMNAIKGTWEPLELHIGHADAGHKPDIPNLVWIDPRLIEKNQEINNKDRFIYAAHKLYNNYLFMTSQQGNWSQIKKNLNSIIAEPINENQLNKYEEQLEQRCDKFQKLLSEYCSDNTYDPLNWLMKAVNEKISKDNITEQELSFIPDYQKSDWFNFQEAVKEYQKTANRKLEPIFGSIEFKNW